MPTHQSIGAENSQRVETVRPQPVEPYPETAFSPTETEPSAVPMGNHGQLLAQRQVFEVEVSAASEEAGQGNQKRKQGCFHPGDATERAPKKSTESIRI